MAITLDDAVQTFALECRELLEEMETALLGLEQSADPETINAIFRAAHTIKGSSGVFGFDQLGAFTHVAENLLERVRAGVVPVSADLIALLLASRDHMGLLVEAAVSGREPQPEARAQGEALMAELRARLGARPAAAAATAAAADRSAAPAGPTVSSDAWHLSLRFSPELLQHGLDPLSLLRYLGGLGEITGVALVGEVPALSQLDPERCHLGLEIDLKGSFGREAIDGALEFFADDTAIRIVPPRAEIELYQRLITELPEDNLRLGEILVRIGALTRAELAQALTAQVSEALEVSAIGARRLGEILVDEGKVDAQVVEAAARKQSAARHGSPAARGLRVDAEKLDRLINLVGELVIAGATTHLRAERLGDEPLMESMSAMSRLVEEIRDSALKLRMVQIGETFSRFQRVVRDVSRELGKEIELIIRGAETELDKTLVEKIGDPLMHLLRNAMDHGIEPPTLRERQGKPRTAQVSLNAYHDSGSIVIEVADDGRGLDCERILAKARERGLVGPGQQLTTAEIHRLIFEAGFSTAEQVTALSGRGVGMDVVRKNIEALRGCVEVDSRPGEGTLFTIRLPLTLAIIDGFLVGVGRSSYVIPLDMVMECIEVTDEVRAETLSDERYINLRGEVLPFVRLSELFEEERPVDARENIVVVNWAGQKAGLVVDALLGEFQTVIKPLGKIFQNLTGVSGATILGSGEVAVILDVPQLVQSAAASKSPGRPMATLH